MKIIQDNGGFSPDELQRYKYIVYGNCVTQMKVLVSAAMKLGFPFEEQNMKRSERLTKVAAGADSWSNELGEDIKMLWKDKGIQRTYEQRDKMFQLNDSASYFFDNIDRFMSPSYIPTQSDVLRARVRSTGIEEASFRFDREIYKMIDVGGQRSERRKWIHCFDNVSTIMFCASLIEYDQTLREDETQNRMTESLKLLEQITNSQYFKNTPFIIFLNKTDLLQDKIKQVPLTTYFSDFNGSTYEEACEFIKDKYLKVYRSSRQPFVHFTCAISTENINVVFKACRKEVLNSLINANLFL